MYNPIDYSELEDAMHGIDAYKELCNARIIRIDGPINTQMATHVCTLLQIMDNKSDVDEDGFYDPIWLYINSPGGSVYDGLAIEDTMKICKCPIFTVVDGMAASMAQHIAGSGDLRFATKNSTIMVHEVASGTEGKISVMEEDVNQTKKLNNLMSAINAENCGMTLAAFNRKIKKTDLYLTAEEAMHFGDKGFIDKILEAKEKKVNPKYSF